MRKLFILIFPAFLALLPIGCATMAVNFTQTTSPDFWAIENGCQTQLAQIQSSVQANQIPFTLGDGLKTNDDIIRRLNHQYRDNSAGTIDLTTSQFAFLEKLLKDNDSFLADAAQNPDDWADAFSGQDDYVQYHRAPQDQDFSDVIQRGRFIVYLNMRIKEDIDKALGLAQSGQLSIDQAQQLQSNLNDVQGKAVEDYYANNALDLTGDQIFQLRRMLADSYQALNTAPAQTYYGGGSFYSAPSDSWANNPAPVAGGGNYYQSPASASYYNPPIQGQTGSTPKTPIPTPTHSTNGNLESHRLNNYGNGKNPANQPVTDSSTSITPVPTVPTDTPAPVPTVPAPSFNNRSNNGSSNHHFHSSSKNQSAPATPTPVPPVAPDVSTPTPGS
jgi:hypothetical protein